MGEEEKNQIIGRLVTEHAQAKQVLELVRADLYQTGCVLWAIGERLKTYDISGAKSQLDRFSGFVKNDLTSLKESLDGFDDLAAKVREYADQLARLGINHT